jgi:hypothetical protein
MFVRRRIQCSERLLISRNGRKNYYAAEGFLAGIDSSGKVGWEKICAPPSAISVIVPGGITGKSSPYATQRSAHSGLKPTSPKFRRAK